MPDEDRRRPESIPREVIWTEEQRATFRQGLPARRTGNGIKATWSHDSKSVEISGRDTIIIALLGAALFFLCWTNFRGFVSIEMAHAKAIGLMEESQCLLALPAEARIQAVKATSGICNYLFANH